MASCCLTGAIYSVNEWWVFVLYDVLMFPAFVPVAFTNRLQAPLILKCSWHTLSGILWAILPFLFFLNDLLTFRTKHDLNGDKHGFSAAHGHSSLNTRQTSVWKHYTGHYLWHYDSIISPFILCKSLPFVTQMFCTMKVPLGKICFGILTCENPDM